MSAADQKLLLWGSTQGHILTGGGILEAQSIPGVHFQEEHLAHYWLKKRVTKQILRQWLDRNFRSFSIVGAWDRPLFSGGWMESTEHDTESFNLQTPSIFIDMRIPKLRPTAHIRTKENLASCSDNELRLLARQHCFAGYSFPEPDKSIEKSGALVFTRHHIIDWNYHPAFPRSRPNRWWVQTKDVENSKEGTDSFKEFSTVRDKFNNPVYMERWARREPKIHQQGKYLALRKVRTCPAILRAQGLPPQKDSVLVIVGQHWLLAIDRDYSAVEEHAAQVERCKAALGSSFVSPKAQGGGPLFVDNLLSSEGSANVSSGVEYALRRRAAEDYLSLEGSYGVLKDVESLHAANAGKKSAGVEGNKSHFAVQRSTIPWLEGTALPWHTVHLIQGTDNTTVVSIVASADPHDQTSDKNPEDKSQSRLLGEWEVLECSFTARELSAMFQVRENSASTRSKLTSKL